MSGLMTRVLERQEADGFRLKGMYRRARELYRKVLHGSEHLAPEIRHGIDSEIRRLDGEMKREAPATAPAPAGPGTAAAAAFSLRERALHGTASSAELRELAAAHPRRPELIRAFARRLSAEDRPDEAARAYAEAGGLFLEGGRVFQGWLCKVLEWKLRRAPREQLEAVQDAIARSVPRDPVDEFLKSLGWSERVALFSRFSLMWVPPDRTLSPADGLHVVVAGRLKYPEGGRTLQGPAAFGFGGCCADVRSIGAEVLKISRQHLEATFARYPDVEVKYRRMFQAIESGPPGGRAARRGERYSIRTIMNVNVLGGTEDQVPLLLKGFSHELSVGGVSFIDERDGDFEADKEAASLVGRRAQIALKAEGISIEVPGLIVRTQSIVSDGRKLRCLGIQFVDLSPLARSTIFTFAGSANTYSL